MKINIMRIIPRKMRDGRVIAHDAVCTLEASRKWDKLEFPGSRLEYQAYELNIRWPIMLQIQLHVNRYKVGGELHEHIDHITKTERQFRIQFILKNARRGGELLCERFIINLKHFKIFEPCKYRHEVTRVEEGERLLLNLGIRYSFKLVRPCPF